MNNSARSNIFEVTAQSARALYSAFMRGTGNEPVLVLSTQPLPARGIDALEKSMERLGYGRNACVRVETNLADGSALGAQDLLTLVESIDPFCCIITDANASTLVSRTYRVDLAHDEEARVLGRTCVAFRDFDALLETPDGKQKAWALLKKLPKVAAS